MLFADFRLDRPAGIRIDVARPVDLRVGPGGDQAAACPVDHVHEAIAVELHEDLALAPVDLDVGVDQLPARVVVVGVVGRELVVPDDLAGLGPDRQHRRGVQVVAGPRLRRPRRRIARSPVHEIELRIVGARDPGRAAADLPGVAVLRPGLVSLLAASRDRVAAPQALAGLGIDSVDEAAHAELGAGDADHQDPVGDERRERQRTPSFHSATLAFQSSLPSLASSARTCASSVVR